MLNSKYIFVIFLNLLVIRSFRAWASEERPRLPQDFSKFDIFPSNSLIKRLFS